MYNGKLVSSASILSKIYRDFGIDISINYSDAIEWIGEALSMLKVPCFYIDKITDGNKALFHQDYIEIEDGRGKLPCDLFSITQTAFVSMCPQHCKKECCQDCTNSLGNVVCLDFITGNHTLACCDGCTEDLHQSETNCNSLHKDDYVRHYIPMRWATNTFHKAFHGCDLDFRCNSELTYTVNNNYIFTSFSKGKIAMSYKAVPTDEEGLPLIPDNHSVLTFVSFYVFEKIAFQMYLTDKYSEAKYNTISMNRQLYYQKSKNEGKMPRSLDEWQDLISIRNRIIPRLNDHSTFYRHLQSPQQRIIHPNRWTISGSTFGNIAV